MITLIAGKFSEPVWRPVELGNGDSIKVAVRRPTLQEQLQALSDTQSLTMHAFRLRSHIVDWRGVQDEQGKPVPYSWDALGQLCQSYDSAIWELLDVVRDAFSDEVGAEKKPNPPLPAGGTATTIETTPTTPSSNFVANSAESGDSVTASD